MGKEDAGAGANRPSRLEFVDRAQRRKIGRVIHLVILPGQQNAPRHETVAVPVRPCADRKIEWGVLQITDPDRRESLVVHIEWSEKPAGDDGEPRSGGVVDLGVFDRVEELTLVPVRSAGFKNQSAQDRKSVV